jgi:mannose-6-phosphate isomerase-like protein (cupin superfamily)
MTSEGFAYIRQVDHAAFAADPTARLSEKLLDRSNGAEAAGVTYIRTPPGEGSPRGMHTHEWEQLFYILEGTMMIEVEGHGEFPAEPGSLVVFPKGARHRNWNAGDVATVHLAVNIPPPPLKTSS